MRRARELLAASCAAGDGRSCIDLMGREGVDGRERAQLIERACDLGVGLACRQLSMMQPERAIEFSARAIRIWITRCDQARDEVATHGKAPDSCLSALDLAEEQGAPYPESVRARVLSIATSRCDGGDLAMCRVAAITMVMSGDEAGARAIRERAASSAGADCERGELDGCRLRAELLSPSEADFEARTLTAWYSLRDAARGRDAWGEVCRRARLKAGSDPIDPADALACDRARALGADEDSLTPPPPPPPPPPPRRRP